MEEEIVEGSLTSIQVKEGTKEDNFIIVCVGVVGKPA